MTKASENKMNRVVLVKPIRLCVTGTDGSGKSTVLQQLREMFDVEFGKRTITVSIWDQIASHDNSMLTSREVVKEYVKCLTRMGRFSFVVHLWMEALSRASEMNADILLLDAYWYKYAAAELALGEEPGDLLKYGALLPEPHATWYLAIPPKDAAIRKSSYGDFECGYCGSNDVSKFVEFQNLVRLHLESILGTCTDVCRLDGKRESHDLCIEIVRRLIQAELMS